MTNYTRASQTAAVTILVIAALLLAVASLTGSRQETGQTETSEFNLSDHPDETVMVISKGEREGFSLLGIVFREPEYHVDVSFVAPSACTEHLANVEMWPLTESACVGPEALSGPITGWGRTAAGDAIVSVEVRISEACHRELEPGMTWPSAFSECKDA